MVHDCGFMCGRVERGCVSACEGERRMLLSVCVYACLASTHVRVYLLAGSCVCLCMFSDYA